MLNRSPRVVEKRWNPIDREELCREPGQYGGLVAGASSDLEHFFISFQLQHLVVSDVDRRLRNGLSVSDWQRRVFVSAVTHASGNEEMPGRLVDCVKDRQILDSLLVQQLD